jgi:DNA-binding SARP family transcriptional activator
MPALTLTPFGPPQLARDGKPLHLRFRQCMALLAYLAVTARVCRRDRLVSLLWVQSDPAYAQWWR